MIVCYRAKLETPSFQLEAFAETPDRAVALLLRAVRRHIRQTGADPEYMLGDADEWQAEPIKLGAFQDELPL